MSEQPDSRQQRVDEVAGAFAGHLIDGMERSMAGFKQVAQAVAAKMDDAEAARSAADSMQFAVRFAAAGAGYCLEQDGAYPLLEKFMSYSGRGHGIGNPDCAYHHAALDGRYEYRITGNRGTARLLDAEISTINLTSAQQKHVSSFSSRKIVIPAGEDFELHIGGKERDGYWLGLEDGPCFIILRQYFYDWDNELPARMMIERIGATYPPPTPSPAAMIDRAETLATWMNSEYLVPNRLRVLSGEPNSLQTIRFPQAYLQGNSYMSGYLVCEPDQAAIIEFDAPDAAFWNIAVFDALGGAIQPHLRQASLNGHQAHVDSDGRFRAVVAHRDPGVANWLDTGGRKLALMMARINGVENAPTATVTVVPFERLRDALPADSRLVAHDERQQVLRRRLAAAYRLGMLDC